MESLDLKQRQTSYQSSSAQSSCTENIVTLGQSCRQVARLWGERWRGWGGGKEEGGGGRERVERGRGGREGEREEEEEKKKQRCCIIMPVEQPVLAKLCCSYAER